LRLPRTHGTAAEQAVQAGRMAWFTVRAQFAGTVVPGDLVGLAAAGNDPDAGQIEYASMIPGCPPVTVRDGLLRHLDRILRRIGIALVPNHSSTPLQLQSGMRFCFLDTTTLPRVLAPVEVRVDGNRITFVTLEGHPIRGTNAFDLVAQDGGTAVVQRSRMAFSSVVAQGAFDVAAPGAISPRQRQEEIWATVHAGLREALGLPREGARIGGPR
jgi:hypothetical protein